MHPERPFFLVTHQSRLELWKLVIFVKPERIISQIDTLYGIDTICRIYIYIYLVEEMFGVNDLSLSHSWAAVMICIQNLGS
jgi:hypothetical protein